MDKQFLPIDGFSPLRNAKCMGFCVGKHYMVKDG